MSRWSGVLFIIVSATAFGAMPVFARLAYDDGTVPTSVLFLRFTMASLAMLLIMAARRIPFPRGRTLLGLALLGAVGYFGQSFTYFNALVYASPALVALILYLYPSIVTILSVIFLKERLTPARIGALLLAVAGAALTIGPAGGGEPLGIFLGIAAAVIYSFYIVVGSRVTRGSGAIASSTVIMAATALVYSGLVAVEGLRPPATAAGWGAIVAIALICTVVAIVTFFAGLAQVGPANAATLSTFEPAISVVLAAAVLGDQVQPSQLFGGLLIMLAVIILARNAAPAPLSAAGS